MTSRSFKTQFVLAIALLGCAALSGCAGSGPLKTTIEGSECKIFQRPPYAVQGRTRYDQNVVDDYVETGVGGCGWKRPASRPPEIQNAAPLKLRVAAAPVKRKSIVRRFRDRVLKTDSQTAPEGCQASPVVVDAPAPEGPPPPPVRAADPLDEFSEPLVAKPVIRRAH